MAGNRRRQGTELGVLLLGYELITSNNIPPVTLATILAQVAIYLDFIPFLAYNNLHNLCLLPKKVFYNQEWIRLIFSPFLHADDMHLYYNMISFLWKGRRLENRLGKIRFAFLIVSFALIINILIVAISFALGNNYMNQCAVGFSGVLFAFKVLSNHYFPNEDSWLFGWIPVPSKYASWLELIVIQILVPNASFVGHLSGILVGLAYTKGPLKPALDFLFETLTGSGGEVGRNTGNNSNRTTGHSSTGFRSNPRQHEDDFTRYTGGLSEEEQLEEAVRESRRQFENGYSSNNVYPWPQPTAPPYERLYPNAD